MKNLRKFLVFILFAFVTVLAFGMNVVKAANEVSLSVSDYATANSWENGVKYTTIQFDEYTKIEVINSGNNSGKYYTSGTNWRMYQSDNPTITITSKNVMSTVKIDYTPDKTGTLTLNSQNQSSGAVIKVNADTISFGVGNTGTATNGQARITNITIVYESIAAPEPTVLVSGKSGEVKVGEDAVQLAVEVKNFSPVGETVWKSSNESVVKVENGLVTFVGMGTADVTATVDEVVSNAISYTVWPDNTNPISIETALAICEFTGTRYTSYKYTAIGTVSAINESNVTLTDGNDSIIVYSSAMASAVAVSNKVAVTGSLIKYSNTTPEFGGSGVTYQSLYTVTFNADGGSEVEALVDVIGGSKIKKPEDPTKAGFNFYAWYNGNEVFDFENDTITSNLTLTAKWVSTALENALIELNTVNAYMSMAYKYAYLGEVVKDTLDHNFAGVSENKYTSWNGKKDASSAVYAGYSSGGSSKDVIQLRTDDNESGIVTTASGGTAASITVVWGEQNTNADRKLQVYGSNTAYESAADLYDDTKKGKLLGEIAITESQLIINESYDYIGFRSFNGAIYLTSISVSYSSMEFTDADFRLKVGIDKALAEVAAQLDLTTAQYGIEVATGTKTVKYNAANELYTVEEDAEGKAYVVVDLGDVLNNSSRITEEFTVRAYIEVEGQTYYSGLTKTYSVKTLVEEYLPMNIPEVNELKSTLEALGYTFN